MKFAVSFVLLWSSSVSAFHWNCENLTEEESLNSISLNGEPFCIVSNLSIVSNRSEEPPITNLLLFNITEFDQVLIHPEHFTSIDSLWISSSNVSDLAIPPGLRKLMLSETYTNQLTIASNSCYHLEHLVLRSNFLNTLPKNAHLLSQLKTIDASGSPLQSLNLTAFSGLINLSTIEIMFAELTNFTVGPANLPSLTSLYLSDNKLTTIPEDLGHLSSLEELWLGRNLIRWVEMNHFTGLNRLKRLSLAGNPLHWISSVEAVQLPVIEFLSLEDCNLGHLNVWYWEMPLLRELDLRGNRLREVTNFEGRFRRDLIVYGALG